MVSSVMVSVQPLNDIEMKKCKFSSILLKNLMFCVVYLRQPIPNLHFNMFKLKMVALLFSAYLALRNIIMRGGEHKIHISKSDSELN